MKNALNKLEVFCFSKVNRKAATTIQMIPGSHGQHGQSGNVPKPGVIFWKNYVKFQ